MKTISNSKLVAFQTTNGEARFNVDESIDLAVLTDEFVRYGQLSRLDGVEIAITKEDWWLEPVTVIVCDMPVPAIAQLVKKPKRKVKAK